MTNNNDEYLYLEATNEVDGQSRNSALWAKAFVLADADEKKARLLYIKLRVEQLSAVRAAARSEALQVEPEPRSDEPDGHISIEKAADIMQEPVADLIQAIRNNTLPGRSFHGTWWVKLPLATREPQRSVTSNTTVPQNTDLKGIGGWLLVLVVTLVLVAPVGGVMYLYSSFHAAEEFRAYVPLPANWERYKTIVWIAGLAFWAACFAAGVDLIRNRKKSAVRLCIVALWIIGPGSWFTIGVLIPYYFFGSSAIRPSDVAPSFFASVVASTIWTAYLLSSKRVANTYSKSND